LDYKGNTRKVLIIDKEDNQIFGKRYKVAGYDIWFEENAFESIGGVVLNDG